MSIIIYVFENRNPGACLCFRMTAYVYKVSTLISSKILIFHKYHKFETSLKTE